MSKFEEILVELEKGDYDNFTDRYLLSAEIMRDFKVSHTIATNISITFLYRKSKVCENCHYFLTSDSNDWCTNEPLNNQIDPDKVLDGWFTPPINYGCSEWINKDAE